MDKDKAPPNKPAEPESLETADSGSASPAGSGQSPPPGTGGKDKPKNSANKAASEAGDVEPEKSSLIHRILGFSRLYLAIFGLVLIIAALAVLITTKMSKEKSNTPASKTTSLTSGQLSQIQGNTTLVGDPKQTLDIQGNAIFEGQGLFRNDLAVATALKVGGAISGQTLNIGGTGNFSQLQVNQKLSVNGDISVSGQLTVQKNLSVNGSGSFSGSLTVSQLSANSLQINGDISINKHLVTNGSIPSASTGALGVGGTAAVNGTDTAGTININTGSSPGTGTLVSISFAAKFAETPHVVVTPIGSAAAGLQYYVTRTVSGFTLGSTNAAAGGSFFSFDYIVIE